ncbi:MAG: hypothetical protein FJ291_22315 [Planctomycetes bacterium]|nr:hypothetical protein [Planctomycetota bacterium]
MPSSAENEILAELRRITRLLVVLAIKGTEQQQARIEILDAAGFSPKDIADFLSTTRNTVNVALVRLRKRKGSVAR